MLAGELGGALALALQQWSQPGVHAFDVVVGQRVGEHGVDMVEDVVDVGPARSRMGEVELPVGVGGADDPVHVPRDDEEHRLLRAQDQTGLGVDAVARHHDVHAFGRPDLNCPRPPASSWTSWVQTPVQFTTTLARTAAVRPVSTSHTVAPTTRSPWRWSDSTLRGGQEAGAGRRRGPGDHERVPRVVGLGVVVAQRTGEGTLLQARHHAQRLALGQLLVARHRAAAGHRVVEGEPSRDVGPLPDAVLERVDERHRLDQVRTQPGQHQLALPEGLAHQGEVQLLEVAQPPVEELGAARGRARGVVTLLDQQHAEATGGGVQRHARAGHTAADHQHVDGLVAQRVPGLIASVEVESCGCHHRAVSFERDRVAARSAASLRPTYAPTPVG